MKKMKLLWYKVFSFVAILSFLGNAHAEAQTPWQRGKSLAASAGTPSASIFDIIGVTMQWLLAILGFLGIIGFVIAGIMYLTAAGDEGQIDRAKEATKYSVIGVMVALLGFIVIMAADNFLNATGGI